MKRASSQELRPELEAVVDARLRTAGQRPTPNRRTIVAVLAASAQPLAAPDILDRRPDLPQSSVYRSLAVLERAGVVHRIPAAGDHARYELAEELTSHHHHLICVSCGAVEDFSVSPRLDQRVRETMDAAAKRAGFTPAGHRLDLVGLCRRCA